MSTKPMDKNRRALLAEFAESTSTPGFGSFHRSRLLWRLLWIVVILAAWSFSAFQSIQLIINYLEYQSKVSVKIQTSSRIPFPAITICNLNPFKREQLQQIMSANAYNAINSDLSGVEFRLTFANLTGFDSDGGNFSITDELLQQYMEMNISTATTSLLNATSSSNNNPSVNNGLPAGCDDFACIRLDMSPINRATALLQYYAFNNRFNFTQLGHSIESMLLSCTFQGVQCSAANFTSWDHSLYGRCHTMTIDRTYPSFVGVAMGLALTLNVDSEHYLPLISPAVGFQVLLHPIEYMPFPADAGFAISPGASTKVAMQQQVFSRLPYPYDNQNCGTLYDTTIALLPSPSWTQLIQQVGVASAMNYTAPLCYQSCYILQCLNMCNCVDADSITYSSINEYFQSIGEQLTVGACDATNQITWTCIQDVVNTIQSNPQICINQCPQPCYEVKYQSQVTANSWPRVNSTEYIRYSALLPTYADSLSSHLVNFDVYFQDLNYESITEGPSMNVYDLLANIGGTFGLFIGACALTLVEFIQLIFALVGCEPANRRRKSITPSLSRQNSAIVDIRRREEALQRNDNVALFHQRTATTTIPYHRNNVLPPVLVPARVE